MVNKTVKESFNRAIRPQPSLVFFESAILNNGAQKTILNKGDSFLKAVETLEDCLHNDALNKDYWQQLVNKATTTIHCPTKLTLAAWRIQLNILQQNSTWISANHERALREVNWNNATGYLGEFSALFFGGETFVTTYFFMTATAGLTSGPLLAAFFFFISCTVLSHALAQRQFSYAKECTLIIQAKEAIATINEFAKSLEALLPEKSVAEAEYEEDYVVCPMYDNQGNPL